MNVQEELSYPSIVFQLKGELYCVNSRDIATILQMPRYEAVPTSAPHMVGIFPHRGEMIQILDLRTLFGHPSLKEERDAFTQMLEDRKQDHIYWVEMLKHAVQSGESFGLATDPHKCAFGKWYDNYRSEIGAVSHQLKKIEDPHRRLHEVAGKVVACRQNCDECERQECLKLVLERAEGEYMPRILQLLDDLKDVFSNTVYHEMTLVLYGQPLALLVDEVISVEQLPEPVALPASRGQSGGCIQGVTHSEHRPGEILCLSVPALLESL